VWEAEGLGSRACLGPTRACVSGVATPLPPTKHHNSTCNSHCRAVSAIAAWARGLPGLGMLVNQLQFLTVGAVQIQLLAVCKLVVLQGLFRDRRKCSCLHMPPVTY